METSVPLAAVLLEYPVAYVPDSGQGNFLCNTPLDVYECCVGFAEPKDQLESYRLFQFSCPSLASKSLSSLLPLHVQTALHRRFQPRLDKLSPGITCRIVRTTTVMDRLAL
ncbi:hypothetical protein BDN72DRAFT_849722 [Pluteus cervinus]|uniref:Uncharacterized protein n=1 Tax=Pluteus cervinus TaxID=181527 RepID=A0ACD3A6V3_9AGAR|nr:hypothetical protein BDN72DRAFT_849722 [Pluteus cervinus]